MINSQSKILRNIICSIIIVLLSVAGIAGVMSLFVNNNNDLALQATSGQEYLYCSKDLTLSGIGVNKNSTSYISDMDCYIIDYYYDDSEDNPDCTYTITVSGSNFIGWYYDKAGTNLKSTNTTITLDMTYETSTLYALSASSGVEFPTTWRTSTYLGQITDYSIVNLLITSNIPSDYTLLQAKDSFSIYYKGSYGYDVAFVSSSLIYAPNDCTSLFENTDEQGKASLSSLASITFENFNTSQVTKMTNMFFGCSSLTSLDLSSFNMSAVTNVDSMLSGCTALKYIKMPSAISSAVLSYTLPTSTWYKANGESTTTLVASSTSVDIAIGYQVTANANGGSITSGWTTTTVRYSLDSSNNLVTPKLTSLPTAEKSGNTFAGWYSSTNGGTQYTTSTEFDADTTMYANWDVNYDEYEVCLRFYKQDGVSSITVEGTQVDDGEIYYISCKFETGTNTVVQDESITIIANLESNFRFVGWYEGIDGDGTYFDSNQSVTFTASEIVKSWNYNGSDFILCACAVQDDVYLPKGWKSELVSMKITGSDSDISDFDSIIFTTAAPSGYTYKNAFSTGIKVYASSSNSGDVAFVWEKKIKAPADSSSLFYEIYATLTFNNFDTSSATNMNSMFEYCHLDVLDISGFDVSNVTTMTNMFSDCTAKIIKTPTTIKSGLSTELPSGSNWYNSSNSKVTTFSTSTQNMALAVGYLITADANGGSITSGWTTTTVKYSLDSSKNLVSPKLTSLPTVEKTGYTFAGWYSTTNGGTEYTTSYTFAVDSIMYANWTQGDVTFPGTWQTEINSSSYMGSNGIDPTTITTIKFKTSSTSGYSKIGTLSTGIEVYASGTNVEFVWTGVIYAPEDSSFLFSSSSGSSKLTSLTSIIFDNFSTSSVTNMDVMFAGCSGLTSLDLSKFDTSSVTNMRDMFYGCSGLIILDLSNFNTSSVTNMDAMFSCCRGLTSIIFGDNFDTTQVTHMMQMFDGCSGLTSLDLSKFDTSSVTNMAYMFDLCRGLTTLDLSKFDTSSVVDMANMFNACSGLTSLDLSKFDTSSVTDMSYMFSVCSGLTGLDLSNFDTSSVTDMRCMFYGCSGLTSLDLSNFDTSSVTNMRYMFAECSELISLDLSSFDISSLLADSGDEASYMFTGYTSLVYIKLPTAISSSVVVSLPTSNGTWYLNDNTTSTTLVATSGTNTAVAVGYTITANANGGSITSGWTTTTIKYSLDSNNNLVAPKLTSLPTAEKTGYTCSGWYLTTDTTTQVTLNTEFNQDTEIIAEWGGNTFTITYNLDGGVVDTVNPTEYTITTATFTLNNPTKAGFSFVGWTGSNGSTPEKTVTVVNGSTGNLTYTANWLKQQAKPTVVDGLVYNGESQTGVTGTNGEFTLVSGKISAVKAGNYSAIFTLNDGYEWEDGTTTDVVINWSIDRISITDFVLSETSYDFDNTVKTVEVSSVTPQDATYDKSGDWSATDVGEYTVTITGNGNYKGTVTKKWQIVENLPATVTITFDSNGGSSVNSQEIAYNSSLSSLPTTTKTGYVLVGWFDSLQNGNEITTETVFTENTTIYAVWEKQQIKVKLNISGQITEITRNYGDALGNLTNPVKDGYTFKGWYKDEAYTQKVESTYVIIDENLTLYARFEKITQPIEDNKDNENNNSPIVLIVVLSVIGGVAIIGGVSVVLINKKNKKSKKQRIILPPR